mgnify:CR=1 FL=1
MTIHKEMKAWRAHLKNSRSPCTSCDGTGQAIDMPCPDCKGVGKV